MRKYFQNKWVILLALAFTWGSSFILIKKSLQVFSPYQIGSVRVAVSGLLLAGIGIRVLPKMNKASFIWMVAAGALGNFLPMYLFPLAQTHVSSSMAGILDSLVPMFVLFLGLIAFGIRTRPLQWAGVVAGMGGTVILMFFARNATSVDSHPGYALLIVLATLCYAGSALIVNQKLRHIKSLELSAAVFTFWMFPALVILGFSDLRQVAQQPHWFTGGFIYLLILSVVGTALAIFLYFRLIQTTSAVFASMVTYLLPVVAVLWGILAGEKLSAWHALGGILILSGVYLVQDKKELEQEIKEGSNEKHKAE